MTNSQDLITQINSLFETILDLGQFEPSKKVELIDKLKISWITNVTLDIVETMPPEKQAKYGDIITRITKLDINPSEMVSTLLQAFQDILAQSTAGQRKDIIVKETTHIVENLLTPLKNSLDEESLKAIETQFNKILQ